MFCQKCGAQVPEGAGFCHRCGTRIDPKDTASQAASQPGTKPSDPQPAESSPGEETPSKFQLWWAHTPVVGKVFFLLGIAVIAVLLIGLVVNFWEIIFGIAIIASIIFAFVTGSKEDRSEIRRFILKGAAFAPLPELMDRKKRDIMERKGDKEDENKRQKQQKESSAAAL